MATDYLAIREENIKRYGTEIGRIGKELLADRYDDRTHFIFELLQNAEDALGKRGEWDGSHSVKFVLNTDCLTLSHFGRPFDDADVKGICGIAESTKDALAIGRFGIGFKSVYTFADKPEVHSGDDDFAIENYVQPRAIPQTARDPDATLIVLPLRANDEGAQEEITSGFRRLGAKSLLFLRNIDEIHWAVSNSLSGTYLRGEPEYLGDNVRRVTVIGEEISSDGTESDSHAEVDEHWLIFDRDVYSADQERVGCVEIAFAINPSKKDANQWSIIPIADSALVVYFPTVVSTNLGFLVQGPFRTTPSRDNIPRNDSWNQHLVNETSELVIAALRWLREENLLDVTSLRCLPLDREKFAEGTMFAPMFDAVHKALLQEPLLPGFKSTYISASQALLARSKELRELFGSEQLAALTDKKSAAWLSDGITQDRAPELRRYLMHELDVSEMTPTAMVTLFDTKFLEAQPDDWILKLYEYLNGQEAALRRRIGSLPLIRLSDGAHVVASENGKPNAFLPGEVQTDFPTIRTAVCITAEAREFILTLGITEPDAVDDVVRNVLPKYQQDEVEDDTYAVDMDRILLAFKTDSTAQKSKLIRNLRETPFVMAIDCGDGKKYVSKPDEIYLATERLKQLFKGVSDVMIVDDSYECLRGEAVRELLEVCGATRYPRPQDAPDSLSYQERSKLRHNERASSEYPIEDSVLLGFSGLIALLPTLDAEERRQRARLIWESLNDLEERRGRGVFSGTYKWTFHYDHKVNFPAAFVRELNGSAWVPDVNGDLQLPNVVVFDSLGWKPSPFLQTAIDFKPPLVDQLAIEAGIDPAALDLLKKLGITNVADLAARLRIDETDEVPADDSDDEHDEDEASEEDVYDDASDLYGDGMPEIPPGTHDPEGDNDVRHGSDDADSGKGMGDTRSGAGSSGGAGGETKSTGSRGRRPPGQKGGRPFVSYVAAHRDETETDPDGLDQATRMAIESAAIELIISLEPMLRRTSVGNAGYDLCEYSASGSPIRWVEVKAMTGSLRDRPVGLSHTQFDCAREHGDAFWIYVVENATDANNSRIVRIQNPACRASKYTFDRGWLEVAKLEPPV